MNKQLSKEKREAQRKDDLHMYISFGCMILTFLCTFIYFEYDVLNDRVPNYLNDTGELAYIDNFSEFILVNIISLVFSVLAGIFGGIIGMLISGIFIYNLKPIIVAISWITFIILLKYLLWVIFT